MQRMQQTSSMIDHVLAPPNSSEQMQQPVAYGKTNVSDTERMISGVLGGALAVFGLWRRSPGSIALAITGGFLAYRAITGNCPVYNAIGADTAAQGSTDDLLQGKGIQVAKTVIINRPRQDLYQYWRNFGNLAQFMKHLEAVRMLGENRSFWVAKAPLGSHVEWTAEIYHEEENELIAWRSLPDADVDNVGIVRFRPTRTGTEVGVRINYRAPLGRIGATLAKLFGEEPGRQLDEDLRRFKQIMETGEIPTTDGQTSGRIAANSFSRSDDPSVRQPRRFGWGTRDSVEEASWESFPASDSPAWVCDHPT